MILLYLWFLVINRSQTKMQSNPPDRLQTAQFLPVSTAAVVSSGSGSDGNTSPPPSQHTADGSTTLQDHPSTAAEGQIAAKVRVPRRRSSVTFAPDPRHLVAANDSTGRGGGGDPNNSGAICGALSVVQFVVFKIYEFFFLSLLRPEDDFAIRSRKCVLTLLFLLTPLMIYDVPSHAIATSAAPNNGNKSQTSSSSVSWVAIVSDVDVTVKFLGICTPMYLVLRYTKTLPATVFALVPFLFLLSDTFNAFARAVTFPLQIVSAAYVLIALVGNVPFWYLFVLHGVVNQILFGLRIGRLVNASGIEAECLPATVFRAFLLPVVCTVGMAIMFHLLLDTYQRIIAKAEAAAALSQTVAALLRQYDTDKVAEQLQAYEASPYADPALLRSFSALVRNLRRYRPFLPNYVLAFDKDHQKDDDDEASDDVEDSLVAADQRSDVCRRTDSLIAAEEDERSSEQGATVPNEPVWKQTGEQKGGGGGEGVVGMASGDERHRGGLEGGVSRPHSASPKPNAAQNPNGASSDGTFYVRTIGGDRTVPLDRRVPADGGRSGLPVSARSDAVEASSEASTTSTAGMFPVVVSLPAARRTGSGLTDVFVGRVSCSIAQVAWRGGTATSLAKCSALVIALQELSLKTHASLHSLVGDRVFATWNGTRRVARSEVQAARFNLGLRKALAAVDGETGDAQFAWGAIVSGVFRCCMAGDQGLCLFVCSSPEVGQRLNRLSQFAAQVAGSVVCDGAANDMLQYDFHTRGVGFTSHPTHVLNGDVPCSEATVAACLAASMSAVSFAGATQNSVPWKPSSAIAVPLFLPPTISSSSASKQPSPLTPPAGGHATMPPRSSTNACQPAHPTRPHSPPASVNPPKFSFLPASGGASTVQLPLHHHGASGDSSILNESGSTAMLLVHPLRPGSGGGNVMTSLLGSNSGALPLSPSAMRGQISLLDSASSGASEPPLVDAATHIFEIVEERRGGEHSEEWMYIVDAQAASTDPHSLVTRAHRAASLGHFATSAKLLDDVESVLPETVSAPCVSNLRQRLVLALRCGSAAAV